MCTFFAFAGGTFNAHSKPDNVSWVNSELWLPKTRRCGTIPAARSNVETRTSQAEPIALLRFSRAELARGPVPVFEGVRFEGVLAFVRDSPWWYAPHAGRTLPAPGTPVFFFLGLDRDGVYRLALPLARGGRRMQLLDHAGQLCLAADETASDPEAPGDGELLVGRGEDPYALVDNAVQWLDTEAGGPPVRSARPFPAWAEKLGWCTWDAFYRQVDHEKVVQGVESLRRAGVQPGFVILDDGWLDVEDHRLRGAEADGRRFPGGLGATVAALKGPLGVGHVGAWHALTGYWAGVVPGSPVADGLRLLPHRAFLWPSEEVLRETSIVAPEDAGTLHARLHTALAAAGIDFVKVDGQASLEFLLPDRRHLGEAVADYQAALAGSVAARLPGGMTHCMCHEPYTFFCARGALWRTSDDYRPGQPESHGPHVYRNALVGLLLGALAWPDWDMFQSDRPEGAFHAAARAISGGPIYVSDRPGHHAAALLQSLCVTGGRLLRSAQPARPARECLFVDCRTAPRPLELVNRNGQHGVIGLFNCRGDGAPVEGSFGAADLLELPDRECWAYLHQSRRLIHLPCGARAPVVLPGGGFEIVTLAPAGPQVVPLGLVDKLNGSRAILRASHPDERSCRVELVDGGRAGFRVGPGSPRCRVDGVEVAVPPADPDGLLVLELPRGRSLSVEVFTESR